LAYPEVRFNLTIEGKNTLRTPGSGKLIDSIIAVYGLEIAQNMLEVVSQEDSFDTGKPSITVTGMAGSPRVCRSNRDYISFFVNRRWVNNRMLSFAVEEAYHGLLMQGKHPIAVINIHLPAQEIDVNVHPAKTEVKFQDERAIFGAVQKAVRQVLVQSSPVPRVDEIKPRFGIPAIPFSAAEAQRNIKTPEADSPLVVNPPPITPLISLPLLRVLGQMACNYIIAEGPDGLFLIDQHAAHERILFEKIKNQRDTRKIEVQGLLQPVPLEVDPRQAAVMSTHLGELSDLGFAIEEFGDRTFLVRAVPALLRERNWSAMLRESLDSSSNEWKESLASTLACHSAIRAGQVLSDIEMRELVKQLEQAALPNSCPHGRPTMIQMTIQQIEKEFGRT
jgi:DNA mismatch repair protein MutL